FMAISEKALARISDSDQAVIDSVLSSIYKSVDEASAADSSNAIDALLNVGLQNVEPRDGEFEKISAIMRETNRDMAERGMFSTELLDEMQQHLRDYHERKDDVDGEKSGLVVAPGAASVAIGSP
ncbi:MAG: hypothetical protein KDI09_17125, partial [Halioglobus sp.]|nr:hypothetical protein [Halioglobus sp.]